MKKHIKCSKNILWLVLVWIILCSTNSHTHQFNITILPSIIISEQLIESYTNSPEILNSQSKIDYTITTDTLSQLKFKSEYRLRLHDASYTDTLQLVYDGEPVNEISFKLRRNPSDLGGDIVSFFSGIEKGSDISGPGWNLSYELVLSDTTPFADAYYNIELTGQDSTAFSTGTYNDLLRFSYDVAQIVSFYWGQCHPDTYKTYFRIEDIQSSLQGGGIAEITAGEYQITDVITFYSAQFIIPFKVYSSNGESQTIYLGLDPQATDSIDWILGEFLYPVFGGFDARWIYPINNFNSPLTFYRDYRNINSIPYSDTLEHRLKYLVTANTDTVFLEWNFPPGISGRVQDLVSGNILNVFMSDSGVFGITDFETLNPLRVLIYYNNIIPVELINFSASVLESKVLLNWVTSTETNNMGFEIERKVGNRQLAVGNDVWETIGYVEGYGTTTEPKTYSFIDDNVKTGIYQYRLKQIDFDGTHTHSNVIEVEVNFNPDEYILYQNYPNPFNPVTTIKYSLPYESEIKLSVYSVLGEEITILVNGKKSAGYYEINWNAESFSSGIYFYILNAKAFEGNTEIVKVGKMILLR